MEYERGYANNTNSLFNYLLKENNKLFYDNQEIKEENKRGQNIDKNSSFIIFNSLEKEIADSTRLHKHKLTALIDSLRNSSLVLDTELGLLIHNFENKEIQLFKKSLLSTKNERNYLFNLITGVISLGFIVIIVLYIVIHRDINKQNSYQTKLEVSNRENKELSLSRKNILLTVSHDLRAPLSTISGYAELISEEENKELRNRYTEEILYASNHVIRLANNLLFYYRLEAGQEQVTKDIFHPGRIIENIVYSFRPLAIKKGLGLTVEQKGTDTMVEGDCTRLAQILNNLLSNAIKFTRTGHVHVRAHYDEGRLSFIVRDTGIGISDDNQKEIFRAFEKIDKERNEQGFGLGLSITVRLISLLDGTIRVQSQMGHGSTFEVCLPMKEAQKQEIEMKARFNLSGIKVALVDDNRMQAEITQRMLTRSGIACDYCQNVKELIDLLRNNKYDLLLTDIQMPDIDGYRILELLRNSNLGQAKDIPVIAVTARMDIDMVRNIKASFAGYLHKPFSINELLTIIAYCMEGRTPQLQEADFTSLLEGENDPIGMLDMFIQDAEITLVKFRKAIEKEDYKKISSLIHKGMPLWETIRIGISIVELERLVSLPIEAWGKASFDEVHNLVKAIDLAVDKAKCLKENIK